MARTPKGAAAFRPPRPRVTPLELGGGNELGQDRGRVRVDLDVALLDDPAILHQRCQIVPAGPQLDRDAEAVRCTRLAAIDGLDVDEIARLVVIEALRRVEDGLRVQPVGRGRLAVRGVVILPRATTVDIDRAATDLRLVLEAAGQVRLRVVPDGVAQMTLARAVRLAISRERYRRQTETDQCGDGKPHHELRLHNPYLPVRSRCVPFETPESLSHVRTTCKRHPHLLVTAQKPACRSRRRRRAGSRYRPAQRGSSS